MTEFDHFLSWVISKHITDNSDVGVFFVISLFQIVLDGATHDWGIKVERVEM